MARAAAANIVPTTTGWQLCISTSELKGKLNGFSVGYQYLQFMVDAVFSRKRNNS